MQEVFVERFDHHILASQQRLGPQAEQAVARLQDDHRIRLSAACRTGPVEQIVDAHQRQHFTPNVGEGAAPGGHAAEALG